MKVVLVVLSVFVCFQLCNSLKNGLGLTPQMGWNSWNHFGCGINETVIKRTADAIAKSGLKDAGYEYVNMDDCWQVSRTSDGVIVADPKAFPSGIKSLADYVHSLGLKFGLYSDAGSHTCAGRPGAQGYEKIDAKTYASWGVDYLKLDNCNQDQHPAEVYPKMRDALNATGRPIFFSMCEWGVDFPAAWASEVGNSWRTTNDIFDNYISMLSNLDYTSILDKYAGPGGWNDPDMLEVGNGGMSLTEYQSHFSLWAILKSPLLIGNDVTNMKPEILSILTNKEIIAINQDKLGVQAKRITYPVESLLGAHVIVETCTGHPAQKWVVDGNNKSIKNVYSNLCLDLSFCSTSNDPTILNVYTCHPGDSSQLCGGKNQQWNWNSDGTISSVATGQCLDVWYRAGPPVVQNNCKKDPEFLWVMNHTTGEIKNNLVFDAYPGGCLSVQTFSDLELYAGPLADKSIAVVLFNRSPNAASITAPWSDIGLKSDTQAVVRDLVAHKDIGTFSKSYTSPAIPSHGSMTLKITPK